MKLDFKDFYVVGALVLAVLWTYGFLPSYYSANQTESIREQMTMPWIAAVFSFLGGSVTSWILAGGLAFYRRPIISARLVEEKGCYVTTARTTPPSTTATHQAKFLRLLVANDGRSSIKECSAYVVGIEKIVGGTSTNKQQEVLELRWAHSGSKPRSIPPGAFFYLDIVSLEVFPSGSEMRVCVDSLPNHLFTLVQTPGEFNLQIRLVAENAKPVIRSVTFEFSSQETDLKFDYD